MELVNKVANWLLIIGGLNWGLVGLANTDLVAKLFGADSTLSNIVYILVGLSAVLVLVGMFASPAKKED